MTRDARYEQYTNYEWLIELKYIKEADRRRLEEVKKAGMAQLAGYGESERVKYGFKGGQVKKILLMVVGKSEVGYFEG